MPFAGLELKPRKDQAADVSRFEPGVLVGEDQFPMEQGTDDEQQSGSSKALEDVTACGWFYSALRAGLLRNRLRNRAIRNGCDWRCSACRRIRSGRSAFGCGSSAHRLFQGLRPTR